MERARKLASHIAPEAKEDFSNQKAHDGSDCEDLALGDLDTSKFDFTSLYPSYITSMGLSYDNEPRRILPFDELTRKMEQLCPSSAARSGQHASKPAREAPQDNGVIIMFDECPDSPARDPTPPAVACGHREDNPKEEVVLETITGPYHVPVNTISWGSAYHYQPLGTTQPTDRASTITLGWSSTGAPITQALPQAPRKAIAEPPSQHYRYQGNEVSKATGVPIEQMASRLSGMTHKHDDDILFAGMPDLEDYLGRIVPHDYDPTNPVVVPRARL